MKCLTSLCILFFSCAIQAQQISDDSYTFTNPNPAFAKGKGPIVCIDEAHNNFHTADGRYKPFAKMLSEDGYQVKGFKEKFSESTLTGCALLVIANAIGDSNNQDWSYPHPSAFTRNEIIAVKNWLDSGGNLLLIADHSPIAGAAADLGAVLGIVMVDIYADGNPAGDDVFTLADGTLESHPITNGRSHEESVDRILTFTGQAAQTTGSWQTLMQFGPTALAFINPQQTFSDRTGSMENFSFPIAGWIHAAARTFGEGKVVFLGEAAMCTAQIAGPNKIKMGMNNANAPQNAQFCINVVRWLTGVVED